MSMIGNVDPEVEILGWNSKGPAVRVSEYQPGWRNRKQRWIAVREDKKPRGRHMEQPAHEVVHRVDNPGYDIVAFNKGHFYVVHVSLDDNKDELFPLMVDASQDYQSTKIADGVDIERVEAYATQSEAIDSVTPRRDAQEPAGEPSDDIADVDASGEED